jgi:hypothetical protein
VASDEETLKSNPGTLRESDISSDRVSRRSLLTTLGIGAGVAAAAAVVGATEASAGDQAGGGRCGLRRTYADPYDSGRNADPRVYRVRCTDRD